MIQTLVIIEHDGQSLKGPSLSGVALAQQLGGDYALLVIGDGVDEIAMSVQAYGATAVIVADNPYLAEPLADRYAALIVLAADKLGARNIVAASSTYSKDILPRAAALFDAPMLSDVMAVEFQDGELVYKRPVSAGSHIATVKLDGERCVLTVLSTAMQAAPEGDSMSPIEPMEFDVSALPDKTQFVSRYRGSSSRPELTEARVVVCGGRPLKDKETFEALIGGLADALGGAVGATRAAVDAGMVPNDCQIGQTGKVIAPELYFAIGVSGAIQHSAGVRDSRVIVAINRDPDAAIFQASTYGLVGDLFQIMPELIEAVTKSE